MQQSTEPVRINGERVLPPKTIGSREGPKISEQERSPNEQRCRTDRAIALSACHLTHQLVLGNQSSRGAKATAPLHLTNQIPQKGVETTQTFPGRGQPPVIHVT